MNKFFRRRDFDIQQPSGFLNSLQILGRILHSLSGLIQMTEEEQRSAGIYLGDPYSRKYPPEYSSYSDDKEKR
jgi:hypothetical protein